MTEVSKGPRLHLAAETTFLAWIRTGLTLMGFGFVLARFGMFLRGVALTAPLPKDQSARLSVCAGTLVILAGVAVQFFSLLHYRRFVRSFKVGSAEFDSPPTLASVVAVLLATVGFTMACRVVLVR